MNSDDMGINTNKVTFQFPQILCLLILIFLCVMIFLKVKKIKITYIAKIESCERSFQYLENSILRLSDYSGHYNFPNNFNVKTLQGDDVCIAELIDKPILILYIDHSFCKSCIQNAIIELQSNIIRYGEGFNSIIFSNFNSLRELIAFKESNNIEISMYLVNPAESEYLIEMQKSRFPYYFLIHENLKVSNIFFSSFEIKYVQEGSYFRNIYNIVNNKDVDFQ